MARRNKPKVPGQGYQTGAHTTHRLRYDLVWVPKYRKRVLEGVIAVRVGELLRQACEINGWDLHELNVQADHVHLLIQMPPKVSVSKAVNLLKGGSMVFAAQKTAPGGEAGIQRA